MLATDLILQKIQLIDGVKNSIVVGRDGLILDSFFTEEIDKETLSAIALSMFDQVYKQSSRFGKKDLEIFTLETDTSIIIINQMKLSDEPFIIFTEFKTGLDSIELTEILKHTINSFF